MKKVLIGFIMIGVVFSTFAIDNFCVSSLKVKEIRVRSGSSQYIIVHFDKNLKNESGQVAAGCQDNGGYGAIYFNDESKKEMLALLMSAANNSNSVTICIDGDRGSYHSTIYRVYVEY